MICIVFGNFEVRFQFHYLMKNRKKNTFQVYKVLVDQGFCRQMEITQQVITSHIIQMSSDKQYPPLSRFATV